MLQFQNLYDMKALKTIVAMAAAILLLAPAQTSQAQSKLSKVVKAANVVSALTSSNGISAGKALLGLYTQFKADGKLDFSNQTNLSNLMQLATSISGLKDATKTTDTSSFLSGLISGSGNLVNSGNSTNVLGALTNLANVDLSSIAGTAAKSAATGLLSKSVSSSASETTTSAATDKAASILSGLFGQIVK